jgi:hypothetical protein
MKFFENLTQKALHSFFYDQDGVEILKLQKSIGPTNLF